MNEIINQADEHIPAPSADGIKQRQEKSRKTHARVAEITALRTENRKVFRMDDGSEQAVFYPNAVHAKDDATGEFVESDTTLVVEDDGKHYRNLQGNFRARFSNDPVDNELFSTTTAPFTSMISSLSATAWKPT